MIFEDLIKNIVKDQSMVVGEQLAKVQAMNSGVVAFGAGGIEEIQVDTQNPGAVLEKVVESYGHLFGKASIDVCLNTLRKFPKEELSQVLPDTLKSQL